MYTVTWTCAQSHHVKMEKSNRNVIMLKWSRSSWSIWLC